MPSGALCKSTNGEQLAAPNAVQVGNRQGRERRCPVGLTLRIECTYHVRAS
jgi:hypothetical protein